MYALDEKTLDHARDQMEVARGYWEGLSKSKERKTVAHSDGYYTESGFGYSKRSKKFPQRKAPEGENESAFYVRQYEEISGRRPPPGNDNDLAGDEYAAHAEVKDRIHQSGKPTNQPTGVSRDMCGACRIFYRDAAFNKKEQFVVGDPSFTRAFNPDGTVHIYTTDGRFVRTIPAGKDPEAGLKRNYEGVEW